MNSSIQIQAFMCFIPVNQITSNQISASTNAIKFKIYRLIINGYE